MWSFTFSRCCFSLFFVFSLNFLNAQTAAGDCPYPVLFVHGWTGNYSSWSSLYNQPDFSAIWGSPSDTIWTVNNTFTYTKLVGNDNTLFTSDDDVLTSFNNETNTVAPGCIYLIDMDNFWNQNSANPQIIKGGSAPANSNESDSNESALQKSGAALRKAISAILTANPTKKKVILATYSMGGLFAREYLQRKNGAARQWWIEPNLADGHKVAKLFTVGTPHRGSNTLGNFAAPNEVEDRNGTPDLLSEAVRDMRYSYACGFLWLSSCSGIYLFGGNEADQGSWYRNNDVDCNGSGTTTNVKGINISGATQFGSGTSAWLGTYDNPNFALPTNIRYTYYISNLFNIGCDAAYPDYGCGGDGVVDDERQWIYLGGNGKTNQYLSGASVPQPTDGTNYRLSDRIASTNRVSHTGQQGDTEFVIRGFDEGDFPKFAADINPGIWYAGLTQIRPEKIPANSELTNSGNRMIDGDWFQVPVTSTGKKIKLEVIPQPQMDVRADLYTTLPSQTANTNSTLNMVKTAGSTTLLTLQTPAMVAPGTYYFRITHWLNTAAVPKNGWKTPYKVRITLIGGSALPPENGGEETVAPLEISEIHPQPIHESLHFQVFNPTENQTMQLSIFDAAGRTVYLKNLDLQLGENQIAIPSADWSNGFYFLTVKAGSVFKTMKIVKQ